MEEGLKNFLAYLLGKKYETISDKDLKRELVAFFITSPAYLMKNHYVVLEQAGFIFRCDPPNLNWRINYEWIGIQKKEAKPYP
jgi:hypothetical protein